MFAGFSQDEKQARSKREEEGGGGGIGGGLSSCPAQINSLCPKQKTCLFDATQNLSSAIQDA